MTNLPAKKFLPSEVVKEYDTKAAALDAALSAFDDATTALQMGCTIGGSYGGPIWERGSMSAPRPHKSTCESALLKSAWEHVIQALKIRDIATAKDLEKMRLAMENPPPFTLDTIAATFGKYITDTRGHILRGVAEAFCDLDSVFRSHSKMKVGVAGLPKRIILRWAIGAHGATGSGWREGQLRNVLDALAALNDQPKMTWPEFSDLVDRARAGDDPEFLGVTLRTFSNGNAHLIFDAESLRQINLALAEFYGETLPDLAEDSRAARPQTGTAVSKDLAYYPSPDAVCDAMIKETDIRDGFQILEPSCGDGRILDAVKRHLQGNRYSGARRNVQAVGVEVDAARAAMAKSKGHAVMQANFLDVAPDARFDLVLMNPPFAGKHYLKHIQHALKFLKPGGRLVSVLPLTAWEDTRNPLPKGRWEHLPVASFAECGTNVSTGLFIVTA
jgi:hypothetical protein